MRKWKVRVNGTRAMLTPLTVMLCLQTSSENPSGPCLPGRQGLLMSPDRNSIRALLTMAAPITGSH